MEFYKNLAEEGIRLDYTYRLKDNIISDMPDFSKKSSVAKVNIKTIENIIKGGTTTKPVAEKIAKALNVPLNKVFDVVGKGKKLSEKSINHHHKLISTMLTTAVQWQLIISNPAERLKPPKVTAKEANYYDIPEVYRMFELLEDEPIKYKTMIHIVIFCGLRAGELADLEWNDIDFENETITVSKQLQYLSGQGVYELGSTKSKAGNRIIAMPEMLTELLREYKEWQDNEKVLMGEQWVELDKLFTQEDGKPIFPMTPSKWFQKFIKKNNLPPLTFHQLRHTNISLMVGEGVDIATVGERSGHAKDYVSLRYYTHALKEKNREAAEKLQNMIIKKNDKDD
jgi:integrase